MRLSVLATILFVAFAVHAEESRSSMTEPLAISLKPGTLITFDKEFEIPGAEPGFDRMKAMTGHSTVKQLLFFKGDISCSLVTKRSVNDAFIAAGSQFQVKEVSLSLPFGAPFVGDYGDVDIEMASDTKLVIQCRERSRRNTLTVKDLVNGLKSAGITLVPDLTIKREQIKPL